MDAVNQAALPLAPRPIFTFGEMRQRIHESTARARVADVLSIIGARLANVPEDLRGNLPLELSIEQARALRDVLISNGF